MPRSMGLDYPAIMVGEIMKVSSIVYFLGITLLGIGITVASHEPSAVPITLGIGCIIAALFKYLGD